jgi:serine/threonine-protein kinase
MTHIFSKGMSVGNRYSIQNFLDAGGMQEVYVAHDNILNRNVALKTPKNHHADKRFKRSAVLSAKVNHPNVAKILDYFEFGDTAVIVEELINGKSLDKALKDDFIYFDPYLLAQFGHHVSKGMAASHHAEVIHRDLKPGNIILANEHNVYSFKITDFGIATLTQRELKKAHKDNLTIKRSQTMMGAIPYMAPEMVLDPNNADCASDVWALGAIMYRLMTGNDPYGSGIPAIVKIAEAKQPPRFNAFDLSQFKWLIDELWDIIKVCLKKNPSKRPSVDSLVTMFSNLCYSVLPREESTIKVFGQGTGDWGFIHGNFSDDFFVHRESFYGETTDIVEGRRVQFAPHPNTNRVHPCIPLISA